MNKQKFCMIHVLSVLVGPGSGLKGWETVSMFSYHLSSVHPKSRSHLSLPLEFPSPRDPNADTEPSSISPVFYKFASPSFTQYNKGRDSSIRTHPP